MPQENVEIVYGPDRQLREGHLVLARVEDGSEGMHGRVICGDRTFDIERRERSGWHFQLRDPAASEPCLEFLPNRWRAGGRLVGRGREITLRRGVAISQFPWMLTTPGGWRA